MNLRVFSQNLQFDPLTIRHKRIMKCWKILEIKVEISGEKRAAPEDT